MGIVKLPNGTYANVEDGASPDVIRKIMAANTAKPKATSGPKLSQHEQAVQSRVQARSKDARQSGGFSPFRKFASGYLASFDDELSGGLTAGTRGIASAFRKRDIGEVKREYLTQRDTIRAENDKLAENTGSGVAEIAGAIMNPIKAGKFLSRAPGIVQAAGVGAKQGLVNAAGASEADNASDLIANALSGGVTGAAVGGALGGVVHAGRGAAHILKDRTKDAAERVAYGRVGNMLAKGKTTPERAARELKVSEGRGNDAMVMDLLPSLRAQAGAISRKPNVPSSNDLIRRGEERILARPGKFEDEIRDRIQPKTGQDAMARKDSIHGARKAQGDAEYKAVLEKQFVWNDDLEKFVSGAPPATKTVLKDAVKLVQNERLDPKALGWGFNEAGDVVFQKVPSMRTFDYMKRSFDQHIAAAYKGGDNNLARVLSGELDALKYGITRSHPDYADVLAKQRDFYQKASAVELGQDVLKRMKKEPKLVLRELRGLDAKVQEDARTGIVDSLIALRASNSNPVTFIRGVMRSREQRKILEFAFGGKGNLNRFTRWLDRESRGFEADKLTAPGRQSETARFDMADESLVGNASRIGMDAGRGFAYGGPAGALAAGVRGVNDLRTGTGEAAMDEIAKILLSNGAKLPAGVSAAKKFAERRKATNTNRAVLAAKAGQQLFTGNTGG